MLPRRSSPLTHKPWGGVAPSGQRQEDEVLAMHRIVDGHIVTSYSQGGPLQGVA